MTMLRLMIRGMKKSFFSYLLVFLSVMFTIIIIIANFAFKDSVVNTRVEQLRKSTMNTQLLISPSEEMENSGFETEKIENRLSCNSNVFSWIKRYSFYAESDTKSNMVYLYCMDMEKQREVYDLELSDGNLDFKEKNGVVISNKFAQENGLRINSTFEFFVGEDQVEVIVKAIALDQDFFLGADYIVLSKLELADELFELEGKVNRIDVTLKDLGKIDITFSELQENINSEEIVIEAKYQTSFYDSYVSSIQLAITLFVAFSLFISVYVIFSVFKSCIYKNINEMFTLRSIGFTINNYRKLILGQALIINIVASILGLLLCKPFVHILMSVLLNENGNVTIKFIPTMISIIIVNLVSLLSVGITMSKVVRIGIIDVLKNNLMQLKDIKSYMSVSLSSIMFLCSIISYFLLAKKVYIWGYSISILFALIGIVAIQNYVIEVFSKVIKRIFGKQKGCLGLFAKQIPFHCRSYVQSTSVITLVVMIATITISISMIIESSLGNVYKGADIYMEYYEVDNEILKEVVDSVDTVVIDSIQKRKNINIDDVDVIIAGIDEKTYYLLDYEKPVKETRKDIFSKLEDEKTIVVSSTFLKNIKKTVGDSIEVNGISLEIVGEVSTFENMGGVCWCSEYTFNQLFDSMDYELCLLSMEADVNTVVNSLKSKIEEKGIACYVQSIETMCKENNENNQLIINMIYSLCVVSLIISAISMTGTLIVNLQSRKKDFLIYTTIGLSKKRVLSTELLEALSMGIYSGIAGILSAFIILPIVLQILSLYIGTVEIKFNILPLFVMLVVSCMITMLSFAVTVYRQIFRQNLIEQLKSE